MLVNFVMSTFRCYDDVWYIRDIKIDLFLFGFQQFFNSIWKQKQTKVKFEVKHVMRWNKKWYFKFFLLSHVKWRKHKRPSFLQVNDVTLLSS
jgi:hypothetical protein